jgi:hypothetical protein
MASPRGSHGGFIPRMLNTLYYELGWQGSAAILALALYYWNFVANKPNSSGNMAMYEDMKRRKELAAEAPADGSEATPTTANPVC